VSFEKERLPELSSAEKSFLHEEKTSNVSTQNKVRLESIRVVFVKVKINK